MTTNEMLREREGGGEKERGTERRGEGWREGESN